MFPSGLDDPLRREFRPDPGPLEPPFASETVFGFIPGEIIVPPLEERHDDPGKIQEEVQLRGKESALQDVSDIPPHRDCLYRIETEGNAPEIFRDPVRQIGRTQHHTLLTEMRLVPDERIFVQGVSTEGIEMMHQKHIVQIPLVEDLEVMNRLLIREQIPDRKKCLRSFADLHHHDELRKKALRNQEAGLPVRVQSLELLHEFHYVRIRLKVRRRLDQLPCLLPVIQIRPGELHEEPVAVPGLILRADLFVAFLPGFVFFDQIFHRGKDSRFMVLRIPLPEPVEPLEGITAFRLFMDRRKCSRHCLDPSSRPLPLIPACPDISPRHKPPRGFRNPLRLYPVSELYVSSTGFAGHPSARLIEIQSPVLLPAGRTLPVVHHSDLSLPYPRLPESGENPLPLTVRYRAVSIVSLNLHFLHFTRTR